jgi:hypothetical protein
MRCYLRLFLLLVVVWASVPPVSAQSAGIAPHSTSRRVSVTIVLVDSLAQPNAAYLILRRADANPADVILLRSGADADELSDAIRALLVARQATGDRPVATATLRVRPRQPREGRRPAFPWVHRVLADLRRAGRQPIEGLGTRPAVTIWLPRQHAGR